MIEIKNYIKKLRYDKIDVHTLKIMIFSSITTFIICIISFYSIIKYTYIMEDIIFSTISIINNYVYIRDADSIQLIKDSNNEEINIVYKFNNTQSKDIILSNINNSLINENDRAFKINSVHNILRLSRIVYESNNEVSDTIALKSIVEDINEPLKTYKSDEKTFDDIFEKEYINRKRKYLLSEGYRGDIVEKLLEKEKIRYENVHRKDKLSSNSIKSEKNSFKTYNIIVLNQDDNDKTSIISCCNNNEKSIIDMKWTIYKIEILMILKQ